MAEALGVSNFGVLTALLLLTQIHGVLGDFGGNLFIVKELSSPVESRAFTHTAARAFTARIGVLGVASAVAVLLLPAYISASVQLVPGLILLGASAVQILNSLGVAILQARENMLPATISEVLGRLSTLALVIIEGSQLSLYTLALAMLAGSVVNLGCTYASVRRIGRFRLVSFRKAKEYFYAAFPYGMAMFLGYAYFKVDGILLTQLPLPPNEVRDISLGYYGAAYRIVEPLLMFASLAVGNILPQMSLLAARGDQKALTALLGRVAVLLGCVSAPILFAVWVLSPTIITAVTSEAFLPAASLLRVLLLVVFVAALTAPLVAYLTAQGLQKLLIGGYALAICFNVVVNYFAIPTWGVRGTVWTSLLTEVLLLGALLVASFRIRNGLHQRATAQ